jgi:hypothetical protein
MKLSRIQRAVKHKNYSLLHISVWGIIYIYIYIYFLVALRPNADHGLLILEFYRSHTTTHHSQ